MTYADMLQRHERRMRELRAHTVAFFGSVAFALALAATIALHT